jgi:hypothetical protein
MVSEVGSGVHELSRKEVGGAGLVINDNPIELRMVAVLVLVNGGTRRSPYPLILR